MIYYSIRALVNGMKLVMWMKVFRKRYGRRFTNQLYYVGGGLVLYTVYIVTQKMRIDEKIVNLENKLCEYELLEDTKCDNIKE